MIGLVSLKDPAFNYSFKGFCSIVNQVIDIAFEHNIDHNDFKITIQDDQLKNVFDFQTENVWDYDASKSWLNKFFSGDLSYSCNAHTDLDIEFLMKRKSVFDSIMKIKQEVKKEAKEILDSMDISKTLAVQIRGTDKKTEIPEIPESKILEKINNKLFETRSQSIFLATDDKKYVDLLQSNFPNKVVSLDHSISLDGSPIHFSGNKNILNREVMKEVIILSRLPHFLYCYSNVSFLALTLGIHFFKSMEVLN